MKKSTKSILTSSLLAVALGALSVGSTFALFTSQAQTEIEVASGKVKVSEKLVIEDMTSALAGSSADYSAYTRQDGWVNGGEAAVGTDGTLTVSRMTPGDELVFKAQMKNESNVNIKYRFVFKAVDSTSLLASGLNITLNNVEYPGLLNYKSEWTYLEPTTNAAFTDLIEGKIFMPLDRDNIFQDLSTTYLLSIEAVQGNAYVSGVKEVVTTEVETQTYSDIVAEETAIEAQDTILEETAANSDLSVKVTIPAAANEVEAGDEVKLKVTNLEENKDVVQETRTLTFDIALEVNDQPQTTYSEPIKVEIYVGPNKVINKVMHKNNEILNYTYNSQTGVISFYSQSFSPFSVEYFDANAIHNIAELEAAALIGGAYYLANDLEDVPNVLIDEDVDFKLDLAGHDITAALRQADRHYYAFDNYGTFTLCDSIGGGIVTARGIENLGEGKMTINGGTIIAADTNGGAAIWNEANLVFNGGTLRVDYVGTDTGYAPGCLNNIGTAFINGGNFISVNRRTYAIISSGSIELAEKAGKIVCSGAHGGLAIDSGYARVYGGTYSSTEYYGLYVSNDGTGIPTKAQVIVYGGEFTGLYYSVDIGSDINSPVDSIILINGGKFNQDLKVESNVNDAGISITGGSFKINPTALVAEGYEATLNSDTGYYDVAESITAIEI